MSRTGAEASCQVGSNWGWRISPWLVVPVLQALDYLPDSKARAADVEAQADWQFVKVYTDEGITGTSTKQRAGFQQMVTDALDGKIDLIITKSVSRFVRNTVDSLTTIRVLKDKGVEVFFEKRRHLDLRCQGRSPHHPHELAGAGRSPFHPGERHLGTPQSRFADGKVTVPYSRLLGHNKDEDGSLVINPERAKSVRRIYNMHLGGMSIGTIARTLTDEPETFTAAGNKTWHYQSIRAILTNEKYRGDASCRSRTSLATRRNAKSSTKSKYPSTTSPPAMRRSSAPQCETSSKPK